MFELSPGPREVSTSKCERGTEETLKQILGKDQQRSVFICFVWVIVIN